MRKGSLKVKKAKASSSDTEHNDFDAMKGNGVADDAVVEENASTNGSANGEAHSDEETESHAKKSKSGKGKAAESDDEGDDEKEDEDSGDDFDKLSKSKTSKGKRKSSGQVKETRGGKRSKVAAKGSTKAMSEDEDKVDKEDNEDNEAKDVSEDDLSKKDYKKKTKAKKTSPKKRKSVKAAATSKKDKSPKKKKVTPEVSETEEEYEVEKVVDLRETNGKREFKIRWKGYLAASDTWEAEEGLCCPEAIKAYLAVNPPKEESKRKDKKKEVVAAAGKKGKSLKKAAKKEDSGSEEEDQQEYEVEKVLEVHNKRDGSHEFLIRWKGFSKKDDTWEPEAHLNCRDLIDTFMARVEKAKSVSEKQLRVAPARTDRFTLSTNDTDRRLSKRGSGRQRATYHDFE